MTPDDDTPTPDRIAEAVVSRVRSWLFGWQVVYLVTALLLLGISLVMLLTRTTDQHLYDLRLARATCELHFYAFEPRQRVRFTDEDPAPTCTLSLADGTILRFRWKTAWWELEWRGKRWADLSL